MVLVRRVRLEKPLGHLKAVAVTQWKILKNLILLEVCRKPLRKTKGTVTGELTRPRTTKMHKVEPNLGAPHAEYTAVS